MMHQSGRVGGVGRGAPTALSSADQHTSGSMLGQYGSGSVSSYQQQPSAERPFRGATAAATTANYGMDEMNNNYNKIAYDQYSSSSHLTGGGVGRGQAVLSHNHTSQPSNERRDLNSNLAPKFGGGFNDNQSAPNDRNNNNFPGSYGGGDAGDVDRSGQPGGEPRKAPIDYVPAEIDERELFAEENTVHTGEHFSHLLDETDERLKASVVSDIEGVHRLVIRSFDDVPLCRQLLANLQTAGFTKPTLIQSRTIPIAMAGHDVMGCAQTGSGKTAAFLVPIVNGIMNSMDGMQKESGCPRAIIVAPTRELQKQISIQARKLTMNTSISVCEVYGATAMSDQMRRVQQGCDIVTGTVGRIMHLIEQRLLKLDHCQYVVLDEADRMLDQGFHAEIVRLCGDGSIPPHQTLMFSATFAPDMQTLARQLLQRYAMVSIGVLGAANADIKQTILQLEKPEKRRKLEELVLADHQANQSRRTPLKTLVFVRTKKMSDMLASDLCQLDLPTTTIHGDREQRQREQALTDFKRGVRPILIATDVAARGLDIPGVDHVINFDMPDEIEQYVHRIGRTGRVGNPGRATSFYDAVDDAKLANGLVKVLTDAQQTMPDWLLQAGGISTPFTSGGGGGGGMESGGGGAFGAAANDWNY